MFFILMDYIGYLVLELRVEIQILIDVEEQGGRCQVDVNYIQRREILVMKEFEEEKIEKEKERWDEDGKREKV